jgi:YaiO family outer membrane protein
MNPALLLLVLQAAAPAEAPRHWRGEIGFGADFHSSDLRSTWSATRAALGYRWARGGVNADFTRSVRFDERDGTIGIEAYLPAGRRTSFYLRTGFTPDAAVLPDLDATFEVAHAFPRGWEGSLRYRRMEYPTESVNIYTGGAGLWRQRWYFRLLGSVVSHAGTTGYSLALGARRYFDPRRPESTLDLFASGGREVVTLGPLVPPDLRLTTTMGARWQRPLTRRTGFSLILSRDTEEEAPGRIGVGVGAYHTW